MKKAIVTNEKCCSLLHKWKLVRILELAEYYECSKCKARKVILTGETFCIRWDWLGGKNNTLKKSPAKKEGADNG